MIDQELGAPTSVATWLCDVGPKVGVYESPVTSCFVDLVVWWHWS